MRTYDCFQFYDEVDILRLRLEELGPVVDQFVLVRATLDHRGNPAPFTPVPVDLIADYPILEYTATEGQPSLPIKPPDCIDGCQGYRSWLLYCSFMIEHWHRESIRKALQTTSVTDDDLVMISDVDEIPTREIAGDSTKIGTVGQLGLYYKLNCLADEPIVGTVKYPWWWWKQQSSLQHVREHRYQLGPRLNGGWHFSWMATDVEMLLRKFDRIGHVELATPEARLALPDHFAKREDPFGRWMDRPFQKIGLQHLPHPVRENPEAWRHLLDPA